MRQLVKKDIGNNLVKNRKFNNFEVLLDEIKDVQEFYHNVTRGE